jgi:hypothetical protein
MVPIIVDYTGVEKTHSPGITTPPKPDTTFLFLFMRIENVLYSKLHLGAL